MKGKSERNPLESIGFSGSLLALLDPLVEIILLGPALAEPPLLDGGRPILEDDIEEPFA